MAFKFLVSCLLISSGLAAPQQFFAAQAGQGSSLGSHSSQTVRTPFGTLSSHSKTVAEADGTSHVHRFDTRHHGQGVVRVARPRLVQSGPFAVQAFPSQTPLIVGGNGATPVITAARGASNLFQTPDGRIFAFSNGAQPITPGQLFQTPDGRFFTTAVINQDSQAPAAPAPANNDGEVLEVRDAPEESEVIEEEEVPELTEEEEEPVQRTPETPAPAPQDVEVSLDQTGLPRFAAVPQTTTVIARAPLTPATSRFVAAPVHHHIAPVHTIATPARTVVTTPVATAPVHHIAHAPVNTFATPARTVVTTPTVVASAPVNTFGLADGNTGFFTFPGAGFAFNF